VPENPASPTATSKKATTILKTGGGNGGKGATDAPLSPGDPGSAEPGSSKRISTGAVVGISIAGLFGLAVIVGGIVWFVRKKKRDAQGQQIGDVPVMERYFAHASQLRHEVDGTARVWPLIIPSYRECRWLIYGD
jgi:LPXTG-motif cell wall-anchored protein